MTNISKNPLPEKELRNIFNQFEKSIAKLNDKNTTFFLSELLGKEEMIMLSKRLCAIAMFMEDNSSYCVWQSLHISPTTANKIRLNFDCGRYKHIEKALRVNKKDYEQLWKILDVIIRAGMPPRGRGRWKSIFPNFK